MMRYFSVVGDVRCVAGRRAVKDGVSKKVTTKEFFACVVRRARRRRSPPPLN
jgi:hypothetical protein